MGDSLGSQYTEYTWKGIRYDFNWQLSKMNGGRGGELRENKGWK